MMDAVRWLNFEILLYVCNRLIARIPSHRLRLGFYRHVMRYSVGGRSYIFLDAQFTTRGKFSLGHHSVINEKCRLDSRGTLTIGDNVSISAEVCILTADHDVQSDDFAGRERPVVIEDYVFVGTRAMILPGVRIGRGAVVAAGAIVTRDVEPCGIVAGSPARSIGTRHSQLNYTHDYLRLLQ